MNIESGNTKLVLLCPAWKNWGTAKTVKPGTVIRLGESTVERTTEAAGGRADRRVRDRRRGPRAAPPVAPRFVTPRLSEPTPKA